MFKKINPKNQASDRFTLDEMSEFVGLDSLVDISNAWEFDIYGPAMKYYISEGYSDEEAEEKALEDEWKEQESLFNQYLNAYENIFDHMFDEYADMDVVKIEKKNKQTMYQVKPKKSWDKSAAKIIDVINGYGMFEFSSVRDFAMSIPDTVRGTVLSHLHWIKTGPEVYGGRGSAENQLERALR